MFRPFPCTLRYILTTFQSLLLIYFLTNYCMDCSIVIKRRHSPSTSQTPSGWGSCGETTNPSLHPVPSWFSTGRRKTQQNTICACKTGRGEDFPFFFPPHQFACKWLRSLSFALFLTAVWLQGEDNPRLTIALSHAKEELSFSHRTEGGWQLAETRSSPPPPAYWWPWGNQEEVLSSQLPCRCYRWQTPYQPCVWATRQRCVCACLSLSKSQDKPPSRCIQLLSPATLQGSWIIKISVLKSCATILPTSSTGCFQSVFTNQLPLSRGESRKLHEAEWRTALKAFLGKDVSCFSPTWL